MLHQLVQSSEARPGGTRTAPLQSRLIGADVFSKFLVTLDFQRRRMTLEPYPGGQPPDNDEPEDAAAEMLSGFFRAIRLGNHLMVPTVVNQQPPRLFLIDSGSSSNLIDTVFASESTRVRNDYWTKMRGVQGQVREVSRAAEVSPVTV